MMAHTWFSVGRYWCPTTLRCYILSDISDLENFLLATISQGHWRRRCLLANDIVYYIWIICEVVWHSPRTEWLLSPYVDTKTMYRVAITLKGDIVRAYGPISWAYIAHGYRGEPVVTDNLCDIATDIVAAGDGRKMEDGEQWCEAKLCSLSSKWLESRVTCIDCISKLLADSK